MRKQGLLSLLFFILATPASIFGYSLNFQVDKKEIRNGYIVEKIFLANEAVPKVVLSGIAFAENTDMPAGTNYAESGKLFVRIGVEKKRPFAIVKVPVIVKDSQTNGLRLVTSFSLEVEEGKAKIHSSSERKTDVANSILASGTWYKIGVRKTGIYKIDYNFIASLGVDPSKVNPAQIKIYGNGGAMLAEDNAVSRPVDLMENALVVSSAGSSFGKDDYVLFYGVGTTAWIKDSLNRKFHHQVNLYTDTAYYFINFDIEGNGLRVAGQSAPGNSNINVSTYNYYDYHENDFVDPAGFGKNWYGEEFNPLLSNTTQSFPFDAGSVIDSVSCAVQFANIEGQAGCYFSVTLNGNNVGSYTFNTPTTGDNVMNIGDVSGKVLCNSSSINVQIAYSYLDVTCDGWLDYIELNGRRRLILPADQMNFRDWASVGVNNIAQFQLQNANNNTFVWDVTNPQIPVQMAGSLSGSNYTFSNDASVLHEYVAMNSTNFLSPIGKGSVPNQNLHGSSQVDLIIVTYPDFLDQANQLADFHRTNDHLRVIVATTSQVYNEFSSGGQDLCAIRDFARMFYKRAGMDTTQMPRYLALLGGASYDYKNRLPNNSDFVPVFESAASTNDLISFSTDDFYGFLDDNEYIENRGDENILDIGVGRMPARSVADAKSMISKIVNYKSPNSLGPWRLNAAVAADNDDAAGDHMQVAESMASTISTCSHDLYNFNKIYLDALTAISTPAGLRCPDANAAIDNSIYKGLFLLNYNGHGNTQVWSSDRIFTQDDFNNWQNGNMLPIIVTATCDFGQFDHPQYVSAAEQLVIESNAGAIVMLTTTQAVYSVYNQPLNIAYLTSQFTKNINGTSNTFGDAERISKNNAYIWAGTPPAPPDPQEVINYEKFALLGDPALLPDFPNYKIKIDSILDGFSGATADTMKALGAYIVKGSVIDNDSNLVSGFNGKLSVTIFDKPRNVATTASDNLTTFLMQDNTIYKGIDTVVDGKFIFSFITPVDINYLYGKGKISTYVQNGVTDGAGVDTNFSVGGYSNNPVINTQPPVVRPYINDSLFHDGGITGANTSLYVVLNSETGINVSGNAIGHDLTAVLDSNNEQPYTLNDFYETAPNTYKTGFVNFPLSGLADGPHNITVTAWDVNDNMGSGRIDFIVVDGRIVDIRNLGTYPNPFNNHLGLAHFVFEHNHPLEQLSANIEIFNTAGAQVKSIQSTFTAESSWSNDITWDGRDDNGAELAAGVYVYRLKIKTDRGFVSSAYQKLVISR